MDVKGFLLGALLGAALALGVGYGEGARVARAQLSAAAAVQNLNELKRLERIGEEQANGYRSDVAAIRAWYRGRMVAPAGGACAGGVSAGGAAVTASGPDGTTERGGVELVAAGTAEACAVEINKLMRLQAFERKAAQ